MSKQHPTWEKDSLRLWLKDRIREWDNIPQSIVRLAIVSTYKQVLKKLEEYE